MMYQKLSFIGGGRITQILLHGLKSKNHLPEKIIVCDPDLKTHNDLNGLGLPGLEVYEKDLSDIFADLVFLAVHPPIVKDVIQQIQNTLTSNSIIISLIPVIKIATLQQLAGGFDRIVRLIPNAPSIIGKGYNPVCFTDSISTWERTELLKLFNNWGKTPEVDEDKLEAYAILTAMGPTYFWFQWQALHQLGREFNLNEEEIKRSLHEMILGSSQLLFNSTYSTEYVLDMIPVRPLQNEEENIIKIINNRLSALYSKLTMRK